jgi:hypothetical protein
VKIGVTRGAVTQEGNHGVAAAGRAHAESRAHGVRQLGGDHARPGDDVERAAGDVIRHLPPLRRIALTAE